MAGSGARSDGCWLTQRRLLLARSKTGHDANKQMTHVNAERAHSNAASLPALWFVFCRTRQHPALASLPPSVSLSAPLSLSIVSPNYPSSSSSLCTLDVSLAPLIYLLEPSNSFYRECHITGGVEVQRNAGISRSASSSGRVVTSTLHALLVTLFGIVETPVAIVDAQGVDECLELRCFQHCIVALKHCTLCSRCPS